MMNTYTKALAGLSLIAALASCNPKAEFKSESFVRFNASSYAYNEDAGTVRIPVYAFTSNGSSVSLPREDVGPGTLNFAVENGSAEKDVDFTVSPANGVLSFDKSSVAYIEITLTDKSGEYTGNTDFYITLTGASDGYAIGGSSVAKAKVTIKDLDHPLAAILGTYATGVVADNWGDEYIIRPTIEQVEGSVTDVTISNICPYTVAAGYTHKLKGTVSADHKTLSVDTDQWIVKGGIIFVAVTLEGGKLSKAPTLDFAIDEENHTLTTLNGFGAQVSNGWYDLFPLGGIEFKRN